MANSHRLDHLKKKDLLSGPLTNLEKVRQGLTLFALKILELKDLKSPTPLGQQPNEDQDRLILEVSRSHTTTYQSVELLSTRDRPVAKTST